MATFKLTAAALLFGSTLFASFPVEESGQMLYLLHRGETTLAFERYLEYAHATGEHDFALLQQAGIRLLETGIESTDAETQLMCMFGAGVANTPELLHILEKGIHSQDQRTQLVAMNYLGRQNDDLADELLLESLSSPFLLSRLEGCFQLAQKNHPAVLDHLHSLVVKVPDLVRSLFPQIVVHLDDGAANQYLRQLLSDPVAEVRIEAVLAVAKLRRDDFLLQIRKLATQAHHAQQECCALALGELRDTTSLPLLKEMSCSQRREVRLAAAISLFGFGEEEALEVIIEQAASKELFAIAALGKLREGKELLRKLACDPDRDVRLNATLSLLQQGGEGQIEELLIAGKQDFGFVRVSSPGHCLKAWKTVPSHHQNTKAYPGIVEQTMGLREKVLAEAIELPEPLFLKIAGRLMREKQTDLIPLLVTLLENMRSEASIALIKEGQQQAGEPLIRNYCTLALYRMREEGPYEELLINWAKSSVDAEIIQFREEETKASLSVPHALTPVERSRFLIETFEILAQAQTNRGVEALLHAMAYGNPKNRYALAGLLIRTTE